MNYTLKRVLEEDKEILKNLLEKYDYEFSQYDHRDVNKLGLYGYGYVDYYFTEENRYAYFIYVDDKLAGFVMVIDMPEAPGTQTDYQIAEFFVLYKYRRLGVGKKAFFDVLDMHRGRWQLKRHPKNIASVHFWDKAVDEYTKGNYEIICGCEGTEYDDGSLGDVYFFQS